MYTVPFGVRRLSYHQKVYLRHSSYADVVYFQGLQLGVLLIRVYVKQKLRDVVESTEGQGVSDTLPSATEPDGLEHFWRRVER